MCVSDAAVSAYPGTMTLQGVMQQAHIIYAALWWQYALNGFRLGAISEMWWYRIIIGLKNDLTCNLLFIWIHWIKSIALLITFSFKKTRATSAALLAQIWIHKTTENKISTIAPRQYGPEMVPLVWCTHQWNHNDECSGWNVSWEVLLRAMFWVLNSICD